MRRFTVVGAGIGAGRNELAFCAAGKRLPRRLGAGEKLAQSAVDDRQLAGVARDRDGGLRRAGATEESLLLIRAATQVKRVSGLQPSQCIAERLPRSLSGAGVGIIAARGVH